MNLYEWRVYTRGDLFAAASCGLIETLTVTVALQIGVQLHNKNSRIETDNAERGDVHDGNDFRSELAPGPRPRIISRIRIARCVTVRSVRSRAR